MSAAIILNKMANDFKDLQFTSSNDKRYFTRLPKNDHKLAMGFSMAVKKNTIDICDEMGYVMQSIPINKMWKKHWKSFITKNKNHIIDYYNE